MNLACRRRKIKSLWYGIYKSNATVVYIDFSTVFFFQYLVFYFGTDHELQKNGVFFITGIYDKKTHILKSMNR